MSGDDRQSELAREHKARQEQRAAEQNAKGRRNTFIGAGVAVVVVAAGIFAATTMTKKDDAQKTAAESTPSASPSASASPTDLPTEPPKKTGPVSCTYVRDKDSRQKFVGMPPKKAHVKFKKWTINTNRGTIVVDLMSDAAPCSINSLAFLNSKHFYDKQKCYRLVTPAVSPVHLLQCGDPLAKADGANTEDGTGTSGYTFPDENGDIPLGKGVVFLTQPGEDKNLSNSNFAFSMSDQNTQIQGPFNVVGMVSKGMDILLNLAPTEADLIVNKQDLMNDGGSTAPRKPVIITSMTFK
ncbi:peptidylprolyl isomerase [Nonomuraea sp. NPDC050536]|uniref:peptidylprolyl isomerase n=1 Tax=Nonomuraea sp. NPDC050536 TaxID=3364366 RepID=UPI0037C85353